VRAHYIRPVTDDQGVLLPNVSVSVYDAGTTDLVAMVLYSSDSGADVLTNPYVSNTGVIDFYLASPARVRIGVEQGDLPIQYYEDVDVLAAGIDGQHSGVGANSVALGTSAASAGANATAVGPSASSGGNGATALGSVTNALGDASAAVGSAAASTGVGSVSMGSNSQATAEGALALGRSSQAAGVSSVALGDDAVAAYDRSAALGSGATTTREGQVMLGNGSDVVEIAPGSSFVMSDSAGVRWLVSINTDGSLNTAIV
jgi:hypothetical protein